MARALRLEYAGALYHITSRGDRREDIYDDDFDIRCYISKSPQSKMASWCLFAVALCLHSIEHLYIH